jgi:hypothetical protein
MFWKGQPTTVELDGDFPGAGSTQEYFIATICDDLPRGV